MEILNDNYMIAKAVARLVETLSHYQQVAGSRYDPVDNSIKFRIFLEPATAGVSERLGSSPLSPFYWLAS